MIIVVCRCLSFWLVRVVAPAAAAVLVVEAVVVATAVVAVAVAVVAVSGSSFGLSRNNAAVTAV